MHPIFLQIGPLTISYYGFMAACGFLAALALLNFNRKLADLSSDDASNLIFIALIGGIIGARTFYVIQFFDQFRNHLADIIRIDKGGLVFYGGFFLAFVSILIYCRKKNFDTVRVLDVLVPSLAIGHAFGRIGCFLHGCCFGKPTELFCGVIYPQGSAPFYRYGATPLHPVQIYESLCNIILAIIAMILLRKSKRGVTMSFYLISYGLLRFLNEFLRGDHHIRNNNFTIAQLIGFCILPAGIICLITFLRKKDNTKND
ncbi:MAG: prolipoprotein diacylglyceryl transferase [Lentisphaeria bacterium]|nr:prolipoprotein diacylglyceryl transferase [Lentisphaeria bacterium]